MRRRRHPRVIRSAWSPVDRRCGRGAGINMLAGWSAGRHCFLLGLVPLFYLRKSGILLQPSPPC